MVRALFVTDIAITSGKDAGVWLYDAAKNSLTAASISSTGYAFQFYEVAVIDGKGSWWSPAVLNSEAPAS